MYRSAWTRRPHCAELRRTALPGAEQSSEAILERWQPLTARQREVMALSVRRRSAKQIADELQISEGRVNQHIANIKQRLGVNDLAGLYDAHELFSEPCREMSGQKLQVPSASIGGHKTAGVSPERISLSDAMPLRLPAPWESDAFRVGPGAFDGPGANLLRIAAVITISLGIPALLVLLVTARWAITSVFSPAP